MSTISKNFYKSLEETHNRKLYTGKNWGSKVDGLRTSCARNKEVLKQKKRWRHIKKT